MASTLVNPIARRVFGFDPGTLFGWSVWEGEAVPHASGVWNCTQSGQTGRHRYRAAREHLMNLFSQYVHRPALETLVAYEDVNFTVFKNKANLRTYCAYVAQIYEAAHVAKVSAIRDVNPLTVKKHAIGYASKKVTIVQDDGNLVTKKQTVTKEQVIDAAIKRFNVLPDTDDHADALFIGHYVQENPCPPPKKTKKPSKKPTRRSTSTSRTQKPSTRSTTKLGKYGPAPLRKRAQK